MGWVADLEYVITGHGGHWQLWWQGQCCGTFPSRRAALGMAAFEARRVRQLGHHVRILVRRPDGDFRVVPLLQRVLGEPLPVSPRAAAPEWLTLEPLKPRRGHGRRTETLSRSTPA